MLHARVLECLCDPNWLIQNGTRKKIFNQNFLIPCNYTHTFISQKRSQITKCHCSLKYIFPADTRNSILLRTEHWVSIHLKLDSILTKQLLDKFFVISRTIKVEVGVISRSQRLRLITLTKTLIILDIKKTESNNCFIIHSLTASNTKRANWT